MKKIILFITLATGLFTAGAQENNKDNSSNKKGAASATSYTFKIIDAPNHTFGYDIMADGVAKIHQTSIPSMPGNDGFKTKMDAQKVAKAVIMKMGKGEMPPTITVEELKALKVMK